jgi:hypothetical protein
VDEWACQKHPSAVFKKPQGAVLVWANGSSGSDQDARVEEGSRDEAQ